MRPHTAHYIDLSPRPITQQHEVTIRFLFLAVWTIVACFALAIFVITAHTNDRLDHMQREINQIQTTTNP